MLAFPSSDVEVRGLLIVRHGDDDISFSAHSSNRTNTLLAAMAKSMAIHASTPPQHGPGLPPNGLFYIPLFR